MAVEKTTDRRMFLQRLAPMALVAAVLPKNFAQTVVTMNLTTLLTATTGLAGVPTTRSA
jgi:hypothetical protein